MANTTTSPSMLMPVPVVGVDPGPQYSTDINSCLSIIDTHNHSAGSGVQITPDGISITSDLSMQSHNLIAARSLRMNSQSAVLAGSTDLGCLSVVSGDLYYNNLLGQQVKVTSGNSVAGTSGSIANLVSPATASFVSGSSTFVWQSDSNTPALMDNGSVIIRNLVASSKGLTLAAPAAMGSDYTLTLPSLPASTKIVNCDTSGNLAASYSIDTGTLQIASNVIGIKAKGVDTAQIADNAVQTLQLNDASVNTAKLVSEAVTQAKKAVRGLSATAATAGQVLRTATSGNFSSSSGSAVPVTNLNGSIVTLGNPIQLQINPDGDSSNAAIVAMLGSGNSIGIINIIRDSSTEIARFSLSSATGSLVEFPVGGIQVLDIVTAGTHTYSVGVQITTNNSTTIFFRWCRLLAYEI